MIQTPPTDHHDAPPRGGEAGSGPELQSAGIPSPTAVPEPPVRMTLDDMARTFKVTHDAARKLAIRRGWRIERTGPHVTPYDSHVHLDRATLPTPPVGGRANADPKTLAGTGPREVVLDDLAGMLHISHDAVRKLALRSGWALRRTRRRLDPYTTRVTVDTDSASFQNRLVHDKPA